ncbi:hypothetical protein [Paraliomyxa miuraensis]|uniref:hypothetical protein n=1 Tax=Paraliomyxa miuraensis TaxID=376150 RepID=UPI00225B382B|nr:hypothetical protein [Paraliomyxa miuraensis]MCX4243345.1 hypothetical protein [Paraliomyxa miuraensis]
MGSKRMLTRGRFLRISASLLGVGSLPLNLGCAAEGGGECEDDPDVSIASNHGHQLVIPLADLGASDDVTYDIRGEASHSHLVTLTTQQLARLYRGETVAVFSTVAEAHDHLVTISC